MPYYAVRIGKRPGIYDNWNACKAVVTGFPSAKYKKFDTKKEAEKFMQEESSGNSFSSGKQDHLHSSGNGETKSHAFVERIHFPSSPVVYIGSCCLETGTSDPIAGIGVYWAPGHPNNLCEFVSVENATNEKTELIAAAEALKIALGMELSSIELRTRSEHLVKSVGEFLEQWQSNGWKMSRISVSDELVGIGEYCKKIGITWAYVPASESCFGIDEAGRLAIEGASLNI